MTRAFRRCERLYVFAKRPALNSSRARFARITYSLPVYCRRKPTPAEAPLPISRCSRIGRHGYAPASRLWRRARKTANNSKLKGSSQAESPGTAGACCTHNSTRRDSTNAHIDAAYLASIKELLWLSTDCKSSGAVQLWSCPCARSLRASQSFCEACCRRVGFRGFPGGQACRGTGSANDVFGPPKDPDFWCAFEDGEVKVIGDEPGNTDNDPDPSEKAVS